VAAELASIENLLETRKAAKVLGTLSYITDFQIDARSFRL